MPPEALDVRDRRWVEIWNNVFMSYEKTAAGEIVPLPRTNVDTGMGLERTLVALNGLGSVYEVDTLRPLVDELRRLASAPGDGERELRVLADHARAACFVIADGVAPGNKDRGYVLRRLLRRCVVFAQAAGKPVDEEGFGRELEMHRERSRPRSGATFAGGLADHSSGIRRIKAVLVRAASEPEGPECPECKDANN